jgi:hypothetical protein
MVATCTVGRAAAQWGSYTATPSKNLVLHQFADPCNVSAAACRAVILLPCCPMLSHAVLCCTRCLMLSCARSRHAHAGRWLCSLMLCVSECVWGIHCWLCHSFFHVVPVLDTRWCHGYLGFASVQHTVQYIVRALAEWQRQLGACVSPVAPEQMQVLWRVDLRTAERGQAGLLTVKFLIDKRPGPEGGVAACCGCKCRVHCWQCISGAAAQHAQCKPKGMAQCVWGVCTTVQRNMYDTEFIDVSKPYTASTTSPADCVLAQLHRVQLHLLLIKHKLAAQSHT